MRMNSDDLPPMSGWWMSARRRNADVTSAGVVGQVSSRSGSHRRMAYGAAATRGSADGRRGGGSGCGSWALRPAHVSKWHSHVASSPFVSMGRRLPRAVVCHHTRALHARQRLTVCRPPSPSSTHSWASHVSKCDCCSSSSSKGKARLSSYGLVPHQMSARQRRQRPQPLTKSPPTSRAPFCHVTEGVSNRYGRFWPFFELGTGRFELERG